jgi:hypothetical protein
LYPSGGKRTKQALGNVLGHKAGAIPAVAAADLVFGPGTAVESIRLRLIICEAIG